MPTDDISVRRIVVAGALIAGTVALVVGVVVAGLTPLGSAARRAAPRRLRVARAGARARERAAARAAALPRRQAEIADDERLGRPRGRHRAHSDRDSDDAAERARTARRRGERAPRRDRRLRRDDDRSHGRALGARPERPARPPGGDLAGARRDVRPAADRDQPAPRRRAAARAAVHRCERPRRCGSAATSPIGRPVDPRPRLLPLPEPVRPGDARPPRSARRRAACRASDYRIVAVSIDPARDARRRAAIARRVYADYASFLRTGRTPRRPLDLQLLVGPEASIAALSERVGFAYERVGASRRPRRRSATPRPRRRATPTPPGFVVVTPDGRISRYLLGVRFDPRELRLALVDAAAGTIGSVSDRLLLLCAHFAPLSGRHDAAVMNLLRLVAVLLVLGLGGWAWRHRRAPVRRTTP